MNGCEEVRELLVAVARGESITTAGEQFAREHARSCPECRCRLENEQRLSAGLSSLAMATRDLPSPALKAALLCEVRRQQKVTPIRRPAVKWAVLGAAAAAVLLVALFLTRQPSVTHVAKTPAPVPPPAAPVFREPIAAPPATAPPPAPVVVARSRPAVRRPKPVVRPAVPPPSSDPEPAEIATDFFEIPYAEPLRPNERADVFRIEMPRAGMAVYGLPVPGGRLNTRIKADVLMGEDGVARAIRFIR
jgi:hypothetical protein